MNNPPDHAFLTPSDDPRDKVEERIDDAMHSVKTIRQAIYDSDSDGDINLVHRVLAMLLKVEPVLLDACNESGKGTWWTDELFRSLETVRAMVRERIERDMEDAA